MWLRHELLASLARLAKSARTSCPLRFSIYIMCWAMAGATALGPQDTVKQVYDRNVNGVKVKCVLISHQENHNRVVCLDASTGALVRQTPFLDREVTIVGAKLFPRFLSYVENGKSRAEVEVTELKTTEPSPPSAFEPPTVAVSNPSCWNHDAGPLVKRSQESESVISSLGASIVCAGDSCGICGGCRRWNSA